VTPDNVTLKTRSGEVIVLALPASLVVSEVYPIELTDIKAGSFIGVGGLPQADGTQRAITVTVFPESARGTGEGRPFDLVPPGTPIVTFRAADRSLLVPGASVSLTAQAIDGKPMVQRINAGRHGFNLPY
jgi:hypothetical protein